LAQANSFLTPPTVALPTNQQANLALNNFPALGASTGARPASIAAHNYAKKGPAQQGGPAPPPIDSMIDFPTVGAAYKVQGKGNSVRDRILGNSAPTHQAMTNVLQAPALASAKASVEEMKASLGPNKFKQLKRLTKDFAESYLAPEGYVDQSAALFDKGYADPDFWSFLPSLLESCPNGQASEHALKYMTSLRRQQFEETKPAAKPLGRPLVGTVGQSWGAGPSLVAAPRVSEPAVVIRGNQQMPNVVAGKKKQAWGGNGSAAVVRAQAPSYAVGAAAATQGPNVGSATKFMARQAKQLTKANSAVAGPKKNKQNDELKALAFGGK
jgi:hypothetical protein